MTESSSSEVFQLTCADLTHSSLIWMARSSTAPMQSSNTGIKSARKSAWILKSSLPPLTEDAQSTCWRSWSLNSPTGSVRKSLLSLSLFILCTTHRDDRTCNPWPSLSTLGSLSRGQTGSGRSVKCSLSNRPTNTRGPRQPDNLSITVQTCCHRVLYPRRTRAKWSDRALHSSVIHVSRWLCPSPTHIPFPPQLAYNGFLYVSGFAAKI